MRNKKYVTTKNMANKPFYLPMYEMYKVQHETGIYQESLSVVNLKQKSQIVLSRSVVNFQITRCHTKTIMNTYICALVYNLQQFQQMC